MPTASSHLDLVLTTRPRLRPGLAGLTPQMPRSVAGLLAGLGMAILVHHPEITYRNDRTYKGGKKAADGIEIRFGGKLQDAEVIERLKEAGFRFSSKQKMWYNLDSFEARQFTEKIAQEELEVDDAPTKTVSFWVLAKSVDELFRQSKNAWYKVEGRIVKGRAELSKYSRPRLESGVNMKKVQIQIFRDVPIDEENANKTEPLTVEPTAAAEPGAAPVAPANDQAPRHEKWAQQLRQLGDGLAKQIDQKLNSATSQQRYTARRGRIAAGMAQDGMRLEKIQRVLYQLASMHENELHWDTLDRSIWGAVRTKSQVLELLHYKATWTDADIVSGLQKDAEIWVDLLTPPMFKNTASEKEARLKQIKGIDAYSDTGSKLAQRVRGDVQAMEEWLKGQNMAPAAAQALNQAAQRNRENEFRQGKIPGFFPTPPSLIAKMIRLAEIGAGMRVLEPSAGKGDIAKAIWEKHPTTQLDVCEINYSLRAYLEEQGFNVVGQDFMVSFLSNIDPAKLYDRVVMNPPFENGADLEHVREAFRLLKPGGVLVAVMGEGAFSTSFKRVTEFASWLGINRDVLRDRRFPAEASRDAYFARQENAPLRAYVEPLPEDTFNSKDSFITTGVNTRLVVLHKVPGAIQQEPKASTADPNLLRARALLLLMQMRARALELEEMPTPSLSGTHNRLPLSLDVRASILNMKHALSTL